jgi:ABC-2 type transport system permease protein
MTKNKTLIHLLAVIVGLILVNVIASYFYGRFDLTKDKRYTLSDTSKSIVSDLDSPLILDVFLEGDFPSEFRLLQTEVKQIIEEFQLETNQIFVNYINPIEDEATRERHIEELTKSGLEPYINTDNSTGKVTKEIIFAWAFASYKDKNVKIALLKRSMTQGLQEQINNSIQALEYTFADGFSQIAKPKTKKIAILKGNGELDDIYIADFLQTMKPYYNLAQFTLDSVVTNPQGTLDKLKQFDLIVAAKPTQAFSENEKLVLDQYTMNGGKSLWLTEAVIMDKDSLNTTGVGVSFIRDLKLNDFFFKYGVRVNPTLVKSLFSAPIMLSVGEGSQASMQPLQWQYSPYGESNPTHPITKNLELVKFDFASPIDTLKNGIKKSILLQSPPKSKLEGVPTTISLADVTNAPDEASYSLGPQNLAVLLEGEFSSVYDKRVLPFKVNDFKSKSTATKMVVISDGDVIKNKVIRNRPQELGFNQLTGEAFGNKEFLLNTVNYLLDDTGLINIRAKEINITFLDSEKIKDNKGKWQLINIVLPLAILALFGFVFNYLRKKKYT